MASQILLDMKQISKSFPGVRALKRVDFGVDVGEIHALVGENGAGKSTLIKILTGAHQKDEGEIFFKGQPFEARSPQEAYAKGIAAMYQEFSVLRNLAVAENIFIGQVDTFAPWGVIDYGRMHREAAAVVQRLGVNINTRTRLKNLSVGQQQMVEICKAMSRQSSLLIMDEPTSALSDSEIKEMFAALRRLKENGVSVIYISHRLQEVFDIADRVTVLRNGERVDTVEVSQTDRNSLIRMMVGYEISDMYPKAFVEKGEVALEVRGLYDQSVLKDVSFQVRQGEILGITGLLGSGTRELGHVLFGANRLEQGQIFVRGRLVEFKNPEQAIKAGLGLLPEDRKREGLVLPMSVRDNITLASLLRIVFNGVVNRRKQEQIATPLVKTLRIDTPSIERKVRYLSGGNQQKVVIAKWQCRGLDILVFVEPTRGIDVGAKVEVHQLLNELVRKGAAVVMISTELPEILGMSDRILVLREGRVTGELQREEADQERILQFAVGGA